MQNPISTAKNNATVRKTFAGVVAVFLVSVIFIGGICAGILYQKITTETTVSQVQTTCELRVGALRDSNKQLRDLLDNAIPPMSAKLTDMYSLLQAVTSAVKEVSSQARNASETANHAVREAKTATATATKAATATTKAATTTTQAAQKVEKAADNITDAISNPPPAKPPADVPDWLNVP